jgi:hypothetical protein
MNYNIFMIVMKDHPVSLMYQREVLPSWKELGHDVKLFDATTPKDLVYKTKLDFKTKTTGKKREFTATEKAVWYSHFELWCKCIDKGPLIVLEHDSKLVSQLPDMSDEGYKFLSFIERDFGAKGKHIAPGSGYYITPPIAERLVAQAVAKPITQNSDGHLSTIMNWKRQIIMNDYYYIQQINFDGLNTIDHKNPNRKFIGPDYEDIDLSSIHRKA